MKRRKAQEGTSVEWTTGEERLRYKTPSEWRKRWKLLLLRCQRLKKKGLEGGKEKRLQQKSKRELDGQFKKENYGIRGSCLLVREKEWNTKQGLKDRQKEGKERQLIMCGKLKYRRERRLRNRRNLDLWNQVKLKFWAITDQKQRKGKKKPIVDENLDLLKKVKDIIREKRNMKKDEKLETVRKSNETQRKGGKEISSRWTVKQH